MRKHDPTFSEVIKGRASFAGREKEAMDAIAQKAAEAANAAYEEESRSVAVLRAVIKMNGLLEKLFQEEPQEEKEPYAEKPELSAL